VKTFFPAYSCGERTRSFLKVQDGCDYCCTYCTIPLARGGSRNPSVASLAAEAHDIAGSGVKEIVITGVNIAEFGRSSGESFLDLLKALNDVDGIERYRISSIEPNLLKEDMIRWMAGGTKFQKHFHIPLQCGSDAVLAAMKRRYNTRMFADKISMIRSIWGDVFFGIDVIAGFPAETDEEFCKSYDFIKNTIHPAFLHVFPYSMRANTPAALMPQVNDTVKTRRVEKLMALSDRLHAEYCGRYAGTRQKVLFESACKNGMMEGYTGNYIRVERPYDASCVGRIVEITL
jgi:threonylcarbamoyladenosine tRNA methylthiotransferase MtaB